MHLQRSCRWSQTQRVSSACARARAGELGGVICAVEHKGKMKFIAARTFSLGRAPQKWIPSLRPEARQPVDRAEPGEKPRACAKRKKSMCGAGRVPAGACAPCVIGAHRHCRPPLLLLYGSLPTVRRVPGPHAPGCTCMLLVWQFGPQRASARERPSEQCCHSNAK